MASPVYTQLNLTDDEIALIRHHHQKVAANAAALSSSYNGPSPTPVNSSDREQGRAWQIDSDSMHEQLSEDLGRYAQSHPHWFPSGPSVIGSLAFDPELEKLMVLDDMMRIQKLEAEWVRLDLQGKEARARRGLAERAERTQKMLAEREAEEAAAKAQADAADKGAATNTAEDDQNYHGVHSSSQAFDYSANSRPLTPSPPGFAVASATAREPKGTYPSFGEASGGEMSYSGKMLTPPATISPTKFRASSPAPGRSDRETQHVANVSSVNTIQPTYGSWQNPLQPSAWRESTRSNYAHAEITMPPGFLAFNARMPEPLDTIPTCSCGDTCQCIGCPVHLFNDATQDYVRSAYASMSIERPSNEIYSNNSQDIGLDINPDIFDEKWMPFGPSDAEPFFDMNNFNVNEEDLLMFNNDQTTAKYGSRDDMLNPSALDKPFSFDSNFFSMNVNKDLTNTQPCRNWRSTIPTPENTRKILRVFIRNKEHIACPDSGSEQNIMSEVFAKENGLEITRNPLDIKPFELGSGRKVWSVGRVKTTVELIGKSIRRRLRFFYVFPTCPVPLILGMALLAEAEILTKNRHMLEPCPAEFFNISSFLWIGSPRKRRKSPCNRMKCTLDGRQLMATADTGSDHNFMCPKCAEREGFYVDTREARMSVQVGDGTFAETIGQVYIHDFSLDWRKPVTELPASLPTALPESSPAKNEQPVPFGTIFHVLPGLPCDVILGRDLLEETDAFNRSSDLSCARTASRKRPFELNIIISRWKKKRKVVDTTPNPKEVHDDERHAEILRRSRRDDEISLLIGDERDRAQAGERALCREWDARHAACRYCHPPNPI
ncbi:uncharacterized protein PAC_06304 [Phialocephala subalpina]|uniref:Uncharacterized protein n=1 Tax=Phialocephala subalpina TaxID=576137 RepID=A0A1L7WUG4_9HELO|nr:uncharacterized protein PAC_06304 [Phialocephala subalpina]